MHEEFSIEIETQEEPEVSIVRITGSLDAHTFEKLEETLNQILAQKQFRIVADLSKVEYISSAGAGVFIGALSEAQEHDGNIVLLNPQGSVREGLELLGLTQIFKVVDTEEAALAAF